MPEFNLENKHQKLKMLADPVLKISNVLLFAI